MKWSFHCEKLDVMQTSLDFIYFRSTVGNQQRTFKKERAMTTAARFIFKKKNAMYS